MNTESMIEERIQRQIEYKEKIDELEAQYGNDIYQNTNSPIVISSETIGGHDYDEIKTERNRRKGTDLSKESKQVENINTAVNNTIPTESLSDPNDAWIDISKRDAGTWRGVYPTLVRDGVYIIGTHHGIVFKNNSPRRIIRLRGTKYAGREDPFSNQLLGPWVTARILDGENFDTDDLSITQIRYDRNEMDIDRAVLLSKFQHHLSGATAQDNISIQRAINGLKKSESGLPDFNLDEYKYNSEFEFAGTRFAKRLRESVDLVQSQIK
jgi:hypothetical protein